MRDLRALLERGSRRESRARACGERGAASLAQAPEDDNTSRSGRFLARAPAARARVRVGRLGGAAAAAGVRRVCGVHRARGGASASGVGLGVVGVVGVSVVSCCCHLVEIEKLLKRQIPRVADTGYEPVSLKLIDAPKKNAANKDTGKKDMRHTKKPTARGAKVADNKRTDSKRVESRGKGRSGSRRND